MVFSKRIKKVFVFSGILLGIVLISLILVSYLFGDAITAFVIKKVNSQLNTEISVQKVDFSIFRRFPNASVIFTDVVVRSNPEYISPNKNRVNYPLLRCKHLFVDVNLFKILFKHYVIRRIVADDGEIYLETDRTGKTNFNILKSENSSGSNDANIDLHSIQLKNINYQYIDYQHILKFVGLAHHLALSGTLGEHGFNFEIEGDLFSKNALVYQVEYYQSKQLEFILKFKREGDKFHIQSNDLQLEGAKLEVKLDFSTDRFSEIDMLARSVDVNLNSLQRLVPLEYQKYTQDFQGKGNTNLIVSIKGKTFGTNFPHIEVNFDMNQGEIVQKENHIKLSDLNFRGNYSNGIRNRAETSSFSIQNLTTSLASGSVTGDFLIRNFYQPEIKANIKTSVDLASFKKFLSLDTIEILEGAVSCDLSVGATFKNSQGFKRDNIKSLSVHGEVKVKDGQLKLKDSNYLFKEINSDIFLGNDFKIENLALKIDDNDFFIQGTLTDAVPYLLQQQNTLNLKAELRSQNLDLSRYFEKNSGSQHNDKYDSKFLFPEDLQAELNVSLSNFTLNKFHARNVLAKANYKPGMYTLSSAVFETMEGRIGGNGAIMRDGEGNLLVKCQTSLKQISINKMFYAFGNFGQNILQDRHLRGSLSGDIMMSCAWDNNLVLNQDAVLVESNLEIINGELLNFEPLNGLSRFIAVSELKDIKFSKLKNQIYIRHQQIIIPNMDINSSAINITGNGIHNFDNHYIYKINVLLSEVLARKARQNKKENDEFGIIEDDGLGKTKIPLVISGFNEDYKISYDTKGMKDIVKESLQKQKTELKTIFKDEFGVFKKDSTLQKSREGSKFKVEWEENNTEKKPVQTKKKKKTFEEEEGYQIEFEK